MNWHIGDEAGGNMRGLLNHPGKEMPKKVNYQLLLKHKCLSFFWRMQSSNWWKSMCVTMLCLICVGSNMVDLIFRMSFIVISQLFSLSIAVIQWQQQSEVSHFPLANCSCDDGCANGFAGLAGAWQDPPCLFAWFD